MRDMFGDAQSIAVIAVLWGIFVTIFWMVVGWRAMRAHEELARSVDRMEGSSRPGG